MISFESDYIEGAHPYILKKLLQTNMEQLSGYGMDHYSDRAKESIKTACQCPDADVYFLVGGTQTNMIAIDMILQACQGVIAADTGHIAIHEGGAVERLGHKVLTLPQTEGKIHANTLQQYLNDFYADENHEHMVFPGMVYISHPTEFGTLYSKTELQEISEVCRAYAIPLYLDGARLAYGLMSRQTDLTLPDIAEYCDVFYIGGTKVGALCGEALVFTKNNTPAHCITQIKQHGALLAKGRLLGIQFDTLFKNDLYLKIGKHAIDMAEKLKEVFRTNGFTFYLESPTNQQFIVLENSLLQQLQEKVAFCFWEKVDDTHTAVRFATSWATKEKDLEELDRILRQYAE